MYEPELKRRTISEVLGEDPSDYYLPTIQRDFVWDEEDIREMIESIQNGYPTGIITIFKTDIEFPAVPLIDSSLGQKEEKKTRRYVLDGQQRLTSLFLIKNNWKITRNREPIDRTPIYFNPDDRTLRIKGKRPVGYDFSELIKMCTFTEAPKAQLQKTLQSLQKNFLDRPIAFYEVEVKKNGKNEEEIYKDMSEIFVRINRAGIRLGNLEMFLSFFASASLGKQEIIKMHKELNAKYLMDLEPLIRFVFSNLGLSQNQITKTDSFKKAIKDIRAKYKEPQIKEIIGRSWKCVENIMGLLQQELGISTTQILPSETVLVPLFQFMYRQVDFGVDKISQIERNRMIKWFLLASFNGLYSSQTNSKVESDLKVIKTPSSSSDFPLEELLHSMKDKIKITEINKKDFTNIETNILRGSAGKKYLLLEYVLLCRNNATDWTGKLLTERHFNELARHHIFPKDQLKTVTDEEAMINHIGNLTFIDKTLNEDLQNKLSDEYLPTFNKDILKKHFIPLDEKLWKIQNYEKFVEQRTELMWQGIERLMQGLASKELI
jgi:hypothetical protein